MRGQVSSEDSQWGRLAVPSVLAAAHELKTPLVLMRQLSYQLESSGGLTPEQKIVQERIRLTAERTLRLVENITQTSRLNDTLFELEPLQAYSVWSEVIKEIQPTAKHLEQSVKLSVPKQPLLVVAHSELLPAILTGLCDNGMSHNPKGSTLKLSAKRAGETIVFSVRDNGPTVDAGIFKNLKNRLGTGPQPLGARPNSSGLGLWVAGHFAEAMASTLSVTRHRSGGMTFSLSVPTSSQLSLI